MNIERIQYTHGPYSISGITGDNHIMAKVGHEKRTIAIATGWPGIESGEVEANKRLLAAAPDLLEALQRILEQIQETGTVNALEGQRALAAISKATGIKL